MSEEGRPEEIALTLGDRINYPYLIAQKIMTFDKAIVKEEGMQSPQEMLESAIAIKESIPDAWRDQSFHDDLDKSYIVEKRDERDYWCGVPVGEIKIKIIRRFDPLKLYHACINLLQRKGYLSRTLYQEIATGRAFQEESDEEKKAKDVGQETNIESEE